MDPLLDWAVLLSPISRLCLKLGKFSHSDPHRMQDISMCCFMLDLAVDLPDLFDPAFVALSVSLSPFENSLYRSMSLLHARGQIACLSSKLSVLLKERLPSDSTKIVANQAYELGWTVADDGAGVKEALLSSLC